jgi:hypothetical protein
MGDIQFALIKKPALVFVALLLFSITLFSGSYFYKQAQLDEERATKAQMRSTRAKIANIVHDTELINTYQSTYAGLIKKGFLGEEMRLAWIEQLEMTAARLELPDLHYQIDSQSELKQERYLTPSGVTLFKSQLTFQTSLLHEGDLLELIADLQALLSGLLVVEHCELSRRNKGSNNSDKGNKLNFKFHGLCNVSWYTTGESAMPDLPSRSKA